MNELKAEIEKIKENLRKVIFELDSLNDDNFKEKIFSLDKLTLELNKSKSELHNKYSVEKLKEFNQEFDILIKEIQKRYDNKLENLKNRQQEVAKELSKVLNSKKLQNYKKV